MKELIGQKIAEIRKMTEAEAETEGWDITNQVASVIVLQNGIKIYASQDDEGNGVGTLFGSTQEGTTFYLMPRPI